MDVERLVAGVRAGALGVRRELWTVARDPLPRGVLGWLPHVHAALFALGVGIAAGAESTSAAGSAGAAVAVCAVAQAGAVVMALSRPVPAWWLSTAAMFVSGELVDTTAGPDRAWPWGVGGIALHTLVLLLLSLRVRPVAAATALAVTVGSGLLGLALSDRGHNEVVGRAAVAFATAVAVGASQRVSRVARSRLAEQEGLTAEERARRTLLEERGRIARELHDVVAHHMSVISIQAQVAPHLVTDPTPELTENLAGIRENAVQALTELRRVLGVLRSADPGAEGSRHAPQPTLDRLGELLDNVRGAGLEVTAETVGEPRPLSPGVGLSAFRIVQEALSNAMRHAPGAAVRVAIGYQSATLTVRVTNSPPTRAAAPSPGTGHGLLGMRERAAMLGGELATGPTPEGGYEVTALLPTGRTAAVDATEDTP
ncbi:sensor histidine kinase [Streptomyces crystallinus]|uniref:histidine kinase n=1 Tax=Streptomyces crystallinus TaxID=68191 RepID=A0ABP3RK00_9ACTN